MVLYVNVVFYFNANKLKGGSIMLEYIINILREAPHTFLHNMLYNKLNDSTFRSNITYNPYSEKAT